MEPKSYKKILQRLLDRSLSNHSSREDILYNIQRIIWLMELEEEKELCRKNFRMTQSFLDLISHSN